MRLTSRHCLIIYAYTFAASTISISGAAGVCSCSFAHWKEDPGAHWRSPPPPSASYLIHNNYTAASHIRNKGGSRALYVGRICCAIKLRNPPSCGHGKIAVIKVVARKYQYRSDHICVPNPQTRVNSVTREKFVHFITRALLCFVCIGRYWFCRVSFILTYFPAYSLVKVLRHWRRKCTQMTLNLPREKYCS